MGLSREPEALCPEAIGGHGPANTAGKCPYCSKKITARRSYGPGDGRVSMGHHGSITHEQEDYLDGLRYMHSGVTGTTYVPPWQDPLEGMGWDDDDAYY